MAAFDYYVRTAPYGSGTATTRQFKDGTTATPFTQNLILRHASSFTYDASALQAQMTALGVYPGAYWSGGATPNAGTSKYAISKISYTHEKGLDANEDFTTWSATLYLEPDPIQLLPEINFQATHYQETVSINQKTSIDNAPQGPNTKGSAIVNTAGQPMIPAIEESKGRMRLEITRAFSPAGFNPDNFLKALYTKSLNAISFTYLNNTYSYPANQLYCTDLRMPFSFDPVPHFNVTMSFEIDQGTATTPGITYWTRHPLSQGTQSFGTTANPSATLGPPQTQQGVLHGNTMGLDINGRQVLPPATAYVLTIETIPEFDFNALNIWPGF